MVKASSFVGGVLLAAAGVGIGWSVRALAFPSAPTSDAKSGDNEDAAPEIAPEDMLVRVTTAAVERGDLPLVVLASGVVRAAPGAERSLSSRASGRVLETFVTRGQLVKQGEILLRFETAPLDASLAQARAALAQADNQLAEFERSGRDRQTVELQAAAKRAASARALADGQLARLVPLHADGLVSDKALAEAEQAAQQARTDQELAERAASAFQSSGSDLQHATLIAARASVESNVREAERVLAEAEVHAVADGQITEFTAQPGEKLEAGAAIGKLLASDGRIVAFSVAASAARRLAIGASATWEDVERIRRSGKLIRVAGEIDPSSGLVEALVAPDPDVPPTPPGFCVRGELELQRLVDVVLVPERAVLRAHDAQVVVVATADGKAKVESVKLLGRHAGLAAIEGEVRAGDRVIVEGGYNLPDGAHIVDAAAALPTNAKGAEPGASGK